MVFAWLASLQLAAAGPTKATLAPSAAPSQQPSAALVAATSAENSGDAFFATIITW
jgi:hypothetical protein